MEPGVSILSTIVTDQTMARFRMWLIVPWVLLLSLMGCGSRNADEGSRRTFEPVPSNVEFEAGKTAHFENLNRDFVDVAEFGKRYDAVDLEAVLEASGRSTVEYIQRLGVSLFRIPQISQPRQPVYFVSLPTPPREFDSLWKETSGQPSEGTVIGVYFDACPLPGYGPCLADQVANPTILVAEETDRWTLIHEMLHFAFDSQRKLDRFPSGNQLLQAQRGTLNRINTLRFTHAQRPSEESLLSIAKELRTLAELTYHFASIQSFEETATEFLLVKKWAEGRLKNVPERAARNAVWYMDYGRRKGLELLGPVRASLIELITEATRNNWSRALPEANAARDFIDEIDNSTRRMIEDAENRTGFDLNRMALPLLADPNPLDRHCVEHSSVTDDWMNNLRDLPRGPGL